MKKKRFNLKVLFLIPLLIFVGSIFKSDYEMVDSIKEGYNGVIIKNVDEYRKKWWEVELEDSSVKKILGTPSNEFNNIVSIGDSIYKIKGKNKCIIVKDTGRYLIRYLDPRHIYWVDISDYE